MKTIETTNESVPLLRARLQPPEPVWRQFMAALLGALISMSTGCAGGWSAAAVPLLMSANATELGGIEQLSSDQASWITSLINLGSLVGSIPAGHMSHNLGRRKFLLYLGFILIFSWLLIIFNFGSVEFLYAGRFLAGFVGGCVCVALSMYANEICCDVIRGRSGVFYDMMQVLGILYVYVVSAVFSLFWATICCVFVPVVFLLTFSWMPESPVYLYLHGHREEAIDCIRWLHGENCDVQKHLTRIQNTLLEGKEHSLKDDNYDESNFKFIFSIRRFYAGLSKITVKSYFLILVLFVVQRSCGATIIIYYAQDVFNYANSSIPSSIATVWLGVIQFLFSASSVFLVDKVGRRILLTFSLTSMIVSMSIFIWYLNLVSINSIVEEQFGWVPVVTLCAFVGLFRLGVGPIPWFMCSELIPTEDQRWALPTIFFVTWSVAFFCSKSYLSAVSLLGYENVFILFVIICSIGVLHTVLFVPETKNKSRRQIQEELGCSSYTEPL